jgi:hypothetical protein
VSLLQLMLVDGIRHDYAKLHQPGQARAVWILVK